MIEAPRITDGIEGFSKEIQVQPSSLGNSEDLAASWVFGIKNNEIAHNVLYAKKTDVE